MPTIFQKETVEAASNRVHRDLGRVRDIDGHQLLNQDQANGQVIDRPLSFNQVEALGERFLAAVGRLNSVLRSTDQLSPALINSMKLGGGLFMGKLALGAQPEDQFPASVRVVMGPDGVPDLEYTIMPIHFGALEKAQYAGDESRLILAAAAASAPAFLTELSGGIEDTNCSTKKPVVSVIKADHGSPLAVAMDALSNRQHTLHVLEGVSGQTNLSLTGATHLHGRSQGESSQVVRAASGSGIASGVPVRVIRRSKAPRHALYLEVKTDEHGVQQPVSMNEALGDGDQTDLALMAFALGLSARVAGESRNEQILERVLNPNNAQTPLNQLVK